MSDEDCPCRDFCDDPCSRRADRDRLAAEVERLHGENTRLGKVAEDARIRLDDRLARIDELTAERNRLLDLLGDAREMNRKIGEASRVEVGRLTKERDDEWACAQESARMYRSARDRAEAAERELERWRHGAPVEGDYVCPHEAQLAAQSRVVEAARAVRKTDSKWIAPGQPDYGEISNAAAMAHVDLQNALDALDGKDTP